MPSWIQHCRRLNPPVLAPTTLREMVMATTQAVMAEAIRAAWVSPPAVAVGDAVVLAPLEPPL